MYEHEAGKKGTGGMMEMMVWEQLTKEQRKTLLLRALDLKIKMKTMKISMMKNKILLMEEKQDLMKAMRDMLEKSS